MTVALQPYPEYKNSGVPWLGQIPNHWSAGRLKQMCHLDYGDTLPSDVRAPGEVPVYGSNGQVGYHNSPNTTGPCIIVGRKGSFGKVNYSAQPVFAIDTTYFIDARLTKANLRYLYYLLSTVRLDDTSRDSAVPGLDRSEAYLRVIAMAPMEEQRQIASFIDLCDRRINRLIRAKRRLIELLNEEKQLIIHRAVTRGLDPNVRLKPSCVDWLGDVPEHWEIWPIGHFARVGNGSTPSRSNAGYWYGGEYPWLNSASVNQSVITRTDQFVTERALEECHLPKVNAGSVLVAITGQGKTRGTAAELCIEATINQHLAFISPRIPLVSTSYLRLYLTAAYPELRRISDGSGSTKGALTCEDIKHFRVLVPPTEEQERLVKRVRSDLTDVEAAAERASREIDLLREYRTRLIADVVTGKLDVRGVELPEIGKDEGLDELDLDEDGEAAEMDGGEEIETAGE